MLRSPLSYLASAILISSMSLFACQSRVFNIVPTRESGLEGKAPPRVPRRAPVVFDKARFEATLGTAHLDGLEDTWLDQGPHAAPHTEGFVKYLLATREVDRPRYENYRTRILAQVTTGRLSPKLTQALRLACYEEQAWDDYFAEFSNRGTSNLALADALTDVLQAMDTDFRDRYFERIPALYPIAASNKLNRPQSPFGGFPAKRALDAFIRYTIDAESFFARATGPEAALAAYDSYLDFIRKKIVADTEFGRYTARDVVALMSHVRTGLAPHWQKGTFDLPFPAYVLLYGSLPNGRARLAKAILSKREVREGYDPSQSRSDFDLIAYPDELTEVIPRFQTTIYQFLVSDIASELRVQKDLKARMAAHTHEPVRERNASLLSPVSILTREDGLFVLLNPPIRHSDVPDDLSLRTLPGEDKPFLPPPRCVALVGVCPTRLSQFH